MFYIFVYLQYLLLPLPLATRQIHLYVCCMNKISLPSPSSGCQPIFTFKPTKAYLKVLFEQFIIRFQIDVSVSLYIYTFPSVKLVGCNETLWQNLYLLQKGLGHENVILNIQHMTATHNHINTRAAHIIYILEFVQNNI